jgi:hypothetical protein
MGGEELGGDGQPRHTATLAGLLALLPFCRCRRGGRIVRYVIRLIAIVCLGLSVLHAGPANAAKRLALLIGNQGYTKEIRAAGKST